MKLFSGVLLGVFLTFITGDISQYLNDKYPDNKIANSIRHTMIDPNLGINDVVSGRCTKYDRNGILGRDYFQCNKIQIIFSDLIWQDKVLE